MRTAMRYCRQGQQGELDWRRECERRMHAEPAGQWIRLGRRFTAGRLRGGERTAAAAQRLTARPGIAFSRDCGRAPRD